MQLCTEHQEDDRIIESSMLKKTFKIIESINLTYHVPSLKQVHVP